MPLQPFVTKIGVTARSSLAARACRLVPRQSLVGVASQAPNLTRLLGGARSSSWLARGLPSSRRSLALAVRTRALRRRELVEHLGTHHHVLGGVRAHRMELDGVASLFHLCFESLAREHLERQVARRQRDEEYRHVRDQNVKVRRQVHLPVAAASAGGRIRAHPELQKLRNQLAILIYVRLARRLALHDAEHGSQMLPDALSDIGGGGGQELGHPCRQLLQKLALLVGVEICPVEGLDSLLALGLALKHIEARVRQDLVDRLNELGQQIFVVRLRADLADDGPLQAIGDAQECVHHTWYDPLNWNVEQGRALLAKVVVRIAATLVGRKWVRKRPGGWPALLGRSRIPLRTELPLQTGRGGGGGRAFVAMALA
eukprot:m.228014 g.228014  ORF g.228014 m.228014 type:complete len:372 (+) comp11680_c0_seq1:1-1116(+)